MIIVDCFQIRLSDAFLQLNCNFCRFFIFHFQLINEGKNFAFNVTNGVRKRPGSIRKRTSNSV